jgi:hypothetical protein
MRPLCLALISMTLCQPATAGALNETAAKIERMGTHSGAPLGQGERLYRSKLSISDKCIMTGDNMSDIRADPPSPAQARYTVPVAQINPDKVTTLAADGLLILSCSVNKGTNGFKSELDISKSNPMIGRVREAVKSGREQGQCNASGCHLTSRGGFLELPFVGTTKREARRLEADVKQLIEMCKT